MLDQLLTVEFSGPAICAIRLQTYKWSEVATADARASTWPPPLATRRPLFADGLVPAELRVTPLADEPEGDVILFVKDGLLSYLEYVYYTEIPPSSWPSPDRLQAFPMSR